MQIPLFPFQSNNVLIKEMGFGWRILFPYAFVFLRCIWFIWQAPVLLYLLTSLYEHMWSLVLHVSNTDNPLAFCSWDGNISSITFYLGAILIHANSILIHPMTFFPSTLSKHCNVYIIKKPLSSRPSSEITCFMNSLLLHWLMLLLYYNDSDILNISQ